MLLFGRGVDKDIVEIHYNAIIEKRLENAVHQTLKGCRCGCQTKRHNQPFKVTIACGKRCFRNIIGINGNLVVATGKVNLREDFATAKLVETFIGSWNYIAIFDSNVVQLSIIYAHAKLTILLKHE